MGNDDRYGDRWQGRDGGGYRGNHGGRDREYRDPQGDSRGWNEGRREEAGWGPGWNSNPGGGQHRGGYGSQESGHGGQGGGFFERASEAARSWFGGGDDDDRQRGGGYERGAHRDNGYGDQSGAGTLGGGGFGGGWGNQEGESWNRDRPGRPGWFTDSVGGERGQRRGAGGGNSHGGGDYQAEQAGGGYGQEQWGSGGYPEQSRGGGGGARRPSGMGSGETGGGSSQSYRPMTGDYGRGGTHHDPHYSEWRRRQMEELDRDYEDYRREHQSKFENEFGSWRTRRQGQRQALNRVAEHMDVVGSDGAHIGTVDKVKGDRIILTRTDPSAGGVHHSVPCSWVENVDGKVTLNRTAEQAKADWRDEERNRALFEKPGQGEEGPHMLNRSFSGTYRDDDRSRDE